MKNDGWEFGAQAEGSRLACLVAEIGGQDYGIPLTLVEEISNLPVLAADDASGALLGEIKLRGRRVLVADTRALMGLPSAEGTQATGIVVVNLNGVLLGLMTDRVKSMAELEDTAVMTPPAVVGGCVNGIVKQAQGYLLLLDCARLVEPLKVGGAL